jgi:hypothetical protein
MTEPLGAEGGGDKRRVEGAAALRYLSAGAGDLAVIIENLKLIRELSGHITAIR